MWHRFGFFFARDVTLTVVVLLVNAAVALDRVVAQEEGVDRVGLAVVGVQVNHCRSVSETRG